VVIELSVELKMMVSLYASRVNDGLKELPTPKAAAKYTSIMSRWLGIWRLRFRCTVYIVKRVRIIR